MAEETAQKPDAERTAVLPAMTGGATNLVADGNRVLIDLEARRLDNDPTMPATRSRTRVTTDADHRTAGDGRFHPAIHEKDFSYQQNTGIQRQSAHVLAGHRRHRPG